MKKCRLCAWLLSVLLLITAVLPAAPTAAAASGPTITTTLTDNAAQRGSKKTFDVWARNASGNKIKATVTLNGEKVTPTWEDNDKASYTLTFTKEGENTVIVSASSDGGKKKQLTYHINYQKAKPGEEIGTAVWSVELFTIGGGYLIAPVELAIREGETSAEQLIRLLHDNGYIAYYSGSPKASFYLGYIASGDSSRDRYNGYQKSGTPAAPKRLNLTPLIPAVLEPYLKKTMTYYDPDDYEKSWDGYLGEFVFTNGAGWMYSVNHVFPNVGFSDTYLSDGDVVRVQLTLGYGADIGGFGSMGTEIPDTGNQPTGGYFDVANKDALTKAICSARCSGLLNRANVEKAYTCALSVMAVLDATQNQVDTAVDTLRNALAKPDAEKSSSSSGPTTGGNGTEGSGAEGSGTGDGSGTEDGSGNGTNIGNGANHPDNENSGNSQNKTGSNDGSNSGYNGGNNTNGNTGNSENGGEIATSGNRNEFTAPNSEQTEQILSIADGIIRWKKQDNGEADGYLLNDTFLELAGSTAGDWYPIGIGRLGVSDNYAGYLAVLKDQVQERYCEPGKLSAAKATEWHRIALAVLAAGGDPTRFGTDADGQTINLIADGTYNRGNTTSLGRQGINGWIWGLIVLDSMRYDVPDDAYNTRDDMILEILSRQLPDGGFALSGEQADPDVTAMALQALAPYYNNETIYSYPQRSSGETVSKSVWQAVDEALDCLSSLQLESGDFASWGTENVESTNQVTVALCCLGIDPLTDSRFIKNGNTLLDGILRYQMSDGGFAHSFTADPDNPTANPGESNTMAGEQTLYTMAALWRQAERMRTLYDFRAEQSAEVKRRISDLETEIAAIDSHTEKTTLEKLLTSYYSIPEEERSYVRNYRALSQTALAAGVDIEAIAGKTQIVTSPESQTEDMELLVFTEEDRAAVDALPDPLTTKQYVLVTTLLEKLRNSEDFDEKETYLTRLTVAKGTIDAIQGEIDAINAEIREKLYPFEKITLKDKPVVDRIVERYEALSEYDRTKIEHWEDVVKTKTKLDNALRGIMVAVVLGILAAAGTAVFVLRIRKKRKRKEAEMEELAAQYAEE